MKCISQLIIFAFLLFHQVVSLGQQAYRMEIAKNSVQKNLRIARQLVDQNAEDSALLYLNAILSRQLNNQEAIFLRAAIYANMQLWDKALSDYNAFLSLQPDNREATYSRGVIRYHIGQYMNAIEDFENAAKLPTGETSTAYFKIDPESQAASGVATISKMEGDIWNYTGLCYLKLQKHEKALESFNKGIKAAPDMDDLYINRALVYEELGKSEDAIRDYQFVISRNPSNSTAEYNLLNLQSTEGANNEKLGSLNSFIDENPDNAHGYAARGLYYYDVNSFDLAMRDLTKACELAADNADYLFNLALCYERLGDPDRAEAGFLKVVALDDTHSGAYFNLGNIKFKEKLFEKAIAFYTLAHAYNPENPAVLHNRALAYFESGMMSEACQDMQQVMQLNASMAEKFITNYCEEGDH